MTHSLYATMSSFDNPGDHMVLPEIVPKEPLGPASMVMTSGLIL